MPFTHQLRTIKNVVRNLFAREALGEPTPAAPAEPRRRFAAMLLGKEPLPTDPEPAHAERGGGALRALFAPESLPEDPAGPAQRRPGILRALFAPEPLPELPPLAPKPGHAAWLRWLFRFEHLDPP